MRGRFIAGVIAVVVALGGATWSAAGTSPRTPPGWDAQRLRADVQSVRIRRLLARTPGRTFGTASASPGPVPVITVHDPAGDVSLPQSDITGAGFAQNARSFAFSMNVVAPTDPATDPNWQNGQVFVAWAMDTNHDGLPEDILSMFPGPGGSIVAALDSLSTPKPCEGTGLYIAGTGYRVTFPNSCLPGGLSFRFQAAMSYTTDPSDPSPPFDIIPNNGWSPTFSTSLNTGPGGYWMLGADGRVYAFGHAVGFPGVFAHTVAMAPRKDGKGYWIADDAGHVLARGTARSFGGSPPLLAGERIATISATSTGRGYWLFSDIGRVFAFGDAGNYGDLSGTPLTGHVVASVATPGDHGYYMVGSDGGIFAFGDPRFHGSTGGMHLNRPVVGMSPTPDGRGYWLVASDGGVFAFSAPFRGSMGGVSLNQPVDGLVAFGDGYLMGAADGGVFNFSSRAFVGSLAEHPPSAPIIGIAAFSR